MNKHIYHSLFLMLLLNIACDKIYLRKIKKEATIAGSGTALGQLKDPSEIRTDGNYLYVSDHGNSRIQRFDFSTLKAKDWWGNENGVYGWHTSKKSDELHEWDPDNISLQKDTLYACSMNDIYKIKISTGAIIDIIEFDSKISLVMDFAVDTKGNLFVMSDYTVYKYNSNGDFIKKFGGYGNDDGQIIGQAPLYMECDAKDNLYVDGNKLVKFNNDGEFEATLISDQHFIASSICFANDKLYHDMGRFIEFDLDGNVIKRWGDKNMLYSDYCVNEDKIYSLYTDDILVWKFRPEE